MIQPPIVPMPGELSDADRMELELLADQLRRMRGMLFGYSERFFDTIRNWAILTIVLLVLSSTDLAPAAVVPVPFIVPFAFLETGYLFFYTVFARRHAGRLEETINERFGYEVLAAHRLEAAYFYPPDAPKVAAFSLGNPFGFVSVATLGYAVGAAILWIAGMVGLADFVAAAAPGGLVGLLVPGAIAWTTLIAAYLLWTFLARPDEERFLRALETAYRRGRGDR
jgi:hypothetical protein